MPVQAGLRMESARESPTAHDLLDAWERGLSCSGAERGVVLLEALLPQRSRSELLALSLRDRDDELLDAHRRLFGQRLTCVVACPSCGVDLEVELPVDDLLAAAGDEIQASDVDVEVHGWVVRGRPLTVGDVLDAAEAPDAEAARTLLLSRCVVSAAGPAEGRAAPTVAELPSEVVAALTVELERGNPTGALDIEQTCPECGHVWTTPFDTVSYLWAEVDAWAQRTLREIHILASAYGWRESDIVAMSARRRALYLELTGRG
jgi:hypothetical protein